jgi:CubicO group peptidase (beta-lactamase class C family)
MSPFAQKFPKAAGLIESFQSKGFHTAAQIYISQSGQVLADTAVSRADIDIDSDSILLWLSAGKPITAIAIARLWQARRLDLDDPVVRFIPEFAARGKETITIRQLLTHTCGFRWVEWTPNWDETIARICNAPLEPRWIPGRTAGYHSFSSWYVLGEIIRRLDPAHRPYETYIAEEIFQPLGMTDCFLAMSPEQFRTLRDRVVPLEVTNGSKTRPIIFDTEAGCSICSPGASARGPARQLARIYEMLLNGGSPLLTPETTQALISRQRVGLYDLTFKRIIDWGLGFIINSAHYQQEEPLYGFGPHASPDTFGHAGNQSSIAFADPQYHLVVAIIFNGMPGEEAHQQRMRSVLGAIYEDLGITN